ncbi:MAG: hypothetical protein ACE361_21465 [Aureliella sp.]
MKNAILDVTGMFFRTSVSVKDDASVLDVMQAAKAQGGDPSFDFEPDASGRFLKRVTVDYLDPTDPPTSRQDPNRTYPIGRYTWDDEANGQTNPQLVWQYYVFDAGGKLLTGPEGPQGKRKIVAFADSYKEGLELDNGYSIVWRLVAIFIAPNGGSIKTMMNMA